MWKLELVSRYSKYFNVQGYKNYGDAIENLLSSILPDREHQRREESLDLIDMIAAKRLLKDNDFLFRTFKTSDTHERVSLLELTFSPNYILRILALNVFAPEILTEYEIEVLAFLTLSSGWIFIKHDMNNIPRENSWFFDLDNSKTVIDYDALYTYFNGNFSERSVQLRLADRKKSGWTLELGPQKLSGEKTTLKEPQKSKYEYLRKSNPAEAESYRQKEEEKLFQIEKEVSSIIFNNRVDEIISLSSKVGQIKSEYREDFFKKLKQDIKKKDFFSNNLEIAESNLELLLKTQEALSLKIEALKK